jgi:hypothetical protein
MSELPEGRQPLLWKDIPFSERPKAHPSTERLEIEKLRERVAELEAALKIISNMPHSDTCSRELTYHGCDCHVEEARAALKGNKNPGS